MLAHLPLVAPVVVVLAAAGLLVALVRFVVRYRRMTTLERARYRHAVRVRRQWKRLAPNLGLARVDENTRGRTDVNGKALRPITVVPRIKVKPQSWGLIAHAATIPKVGFDEYHKAANWIADAWGCQKVEVRRVDPRWVELRGLVGDPLDEHHPYVFPDIDRWVLSIGRNPWGRLIEIPLKELSGVKVAGMPGYGKSMLMLGWVSGLARSPKVQFGLFDGKTSDPRYGDWGEVGRRAVFIVGDNPEAANQMLTEVVRMIKDRPSQLMAERGTHKFWKHGPSETIPLFIVLMDECHNYVDATGLKGKDRELIEANQRLMRSVAKEGRSVGVIPVLGTQKQTGDAIPTAVRDNLEVGICFAVSTLEAAEAALGDAIRKDEPNHPTLLRDKERFAGVCVVTGVPGLGGVYDRVRVGDIDEADLVAIAQDTAHYVRHDVIPAPAPTMRDTANQAATIPGPAVPLDKKTRRKTA